MKSKYKIIAKREDKVAMEEIEFDQETEIRYGYEDRLQIVEVQPKINKVIAVFSNERVEVHPCIKDKVLAVFSNEISIIKIK